MRWRWFKVAGLVVAAALLQHAVAVTSVIVRRGDPGTASERRPASTEERARFDRRVRGVWPEGTDPTHRVDATDYRRFGWREVDLRFGGLVGDRAITASVTRGDVGVPFRGSGFDVRRVNFRDPPTRTVQTSFDGSGYHRVLVPWLNQRVTLLSGVRPLPAILNTIVYSSVIGGLGLAAARVRRRRRIARGRCQACSHPIATPGACPECGEPAPLGSQSSNSSPRNVEAR